MIPDYSRSIVYWCSSAKPSVDTKRTFASQRAGRISPPYLQTFYPSLIFGQLILSPTRVLSVHLRYRPVSPTSLIDDSDISLPHLSSPIALPDRSCTSPPYGLSLLHSLTRVYGSPLSCLYPVRVLIGSPNPYSDLRLPQRTFSHCAMLAIVRSPGLGPRSRSPEFNSTWTLRSTLQAFPSRGRRQAPRWLGNFPRPHRDKSPAAKNPLPLPCLVHFPQGGAVHPPCAAGRTPDFIF
jgi:hypothetical protein